MTLVARFRIGARIWRRLLPLLTLYLASSMALANTQSDSCPASAVRIYLDDAGFIRVNGGVVPASLLKEVLASLNPKPTEVCFAPAYPKAAPAAVAVQDASIALGLPVSYYLDLTYKTRVNLK